MNNPLTHMRGLPNDQRFSLFHLSADHVMIDAVKKAEDSDTVIIRLHEFSGKRGCVEIFSGFEIKEWEEYDMIERKMNGNSTEGSIKFYIKPYEIKTFLIMYKKSDIKDSEVVV